MQRTVFLTALAVLVLILPGFAATPAVPTPGRDTDAIAIPFRYVDGELMIVQGRINDVTGYILIDLGIQDLVLHQDYFTGSGKAVVQGPAGSESKAGLLRADVAIAGLQL
ncbi:MAG: hypothetical protein R3301_19050, partial [Saprospiraceae bacterium]|nr:hypothetical protein [Saprospiraceae bacterium]